MSDRVYVGNNARGIDVADEQDAISKVVLEVDENVTYTAGNNSGRTLTLKCPWGTQEVANNILASFSGFRYQPFDAKGAIVDPALEIGDAAVMRDSYGGIYSIETKYGKMLSTDLSAPFEEEIDHEYPYAPQKDREVTRAFASLQSEMKIRASEISAKVSKTGGSASSFGWTLTDSSWTISANGSTVLKATKSGLEVSGKITATSGKIGGFDIKSNYISSNGQTWGGTNTNGIYIGTSGIQLGTAFKVSSAGKITATGGDFTGTIRCDALYVKNASGGYDAITTSTLQSSLNGGAGFNAGGWGGYSAATLSTGAGWGFNFQNAVTRGSAYTPNYFKASYGDFASVGVTSQLTAKNLWCSADTFQLGAYGTTIRKMTKTINGVTINYLGYY